MSVSIAKKTIPILKAEGVMKAAIFGSFARGDSNKKSDVDFLIKFRGPKSLFDLVRLKLALEEKMNRKVDIVTYDAIHPTLRPIILKEQKVIYEERS